MRALLLSAVLSIALVAQAMAAGSGFYAGLKVMDSIQSTGKVSTSAAAGGFDTKSYSQNTLGGGIYVGFDFFKQNGMPIRAEIEYALRSTVDASYDLKGRRNFGGTNYTNGTLRNQYNMHTLFANVYYDFHNDSQFTPYVGGGLGLAFINTKIEAEMTTAGGAQGSDSYNSTETALAYNLGVGCSYDINDFLTADVAYRFVGTGFHETDRSLYGEKIGVGSANYANELSIGLRFNF